MEPFSGHRRRGRDMVGKARMQHETRESAMSVVLCFGTALWLIAVGALVAAVLLYILNTSLAMGFVARQLGRNEALRTPEAAGSSIVPLWVKSLAVLAVAAFTAFLMFLTWAVIIWIV